jgi:hypothetical protein
MKLILAINGSCRVGGIIDSAVDAVLAGARAQGAETALIRLREQRVEFCSNCRACTQEPGRARGHCVQRDDMDGILDRIEAADGLVLAAPVNFHNVNALFRRFLERTVGYAYWPWGHPSPTLRDPAQTRRSVLIASSAMPGLLLPVATGAPRALAEASKVLGARPLGKLWIGLAGAEPRPRLDPRKAAKAARLGGKLAGAIEGR